MRPERHPRAAARRAAGREGPFRLGRQQGRQGRAAPGRRSATGRATAGSSPRASPPATRSSSTARCASRRRAGEGDALRAASPGAPEGRRRLSRRPARRCPSTSRRARRRSTPKRCALLKGFAPAMKAGPNADRRHRLRRPHRQPRRQRRARQAARRPPCATRSCAEGIAADRIRLEAAGGRHRQRQRRRRRAASSSPSASRRDARHVLPLLHRAADLRGGRLDHHLPRRPRGDDGAAGPAVPDDHAGAGDRVGDLSRRRLEDARRFGGRADRGADQRRRQHALHDVDQLGQPASSR